MVNENNLTQKADEIQEARSEEQAPANTGKGGKPQTTSLIEGANSAAERFEKANAKTEELASRLERISAERRLSGTAPAGQVAKEETQDDKDQTAADIMINAFDV